MRELIQSEVDVVNGAGLGDMLGQLGGSLGEIASGFIGNAIQLPLVDPQATAGLIKTALISIGTNIGTRIGNTIEGILPSWLTNIINVIGGLVTSAIK